MSWGTPMISTPREAAFRGPSSRQGRLGGGIARREQLWGYLFISPWIIGFILFTFLPMAAALVFSFTDFDLREPDEIQFIGLENYAAPPGATATSPHRWR